MTSSSSSPRRKQRMTFSERRAAALQALAQRPTATQPPRFPGETPASGNLPDDPEWAARMLDARQRDLIEHADAAAYDHHWNLLAAQEATR